MSISAARDSGGSDASDDEPSEHDPDPGLAETRLRALIDRLPGAVYRCTYDTDWKSLYMGEGFREICGIAPESLDPAGRSFRDVIVPEDVPRIKEVVAEAVEHETFYSIEYRIVADDGAVRWVEDNGRPRIDDDGSVRWLDGILLDITDRKEARESLRRMNETLEQQVETRTRQVRALAAELAMVEQHERSQIARTLHDELQQFLYGVQVQTKMLTRSLLERTDLDADALPVDPERVESLLQEAIDTTRGLTVDLSPPVLDGDGLIEALQWLRSHMAESHDFTVVLQGDLPGVCIPEEMRMVLFQAVRELLRNAFEHSGADCATVQMEDTGEAVVIDVVDEGNGFDVSDELTGDHPGYGLRTVAERLRFLGGIFSIDSSPGDGTTCTIRLPKTELKDAPTIPAPDGFTGE
jgi:PAS domain S-box-containing protein